MECDSMHARIEQKLKNRDIHTPSEYITVCRNAKNENPYIVKYLSFDYFKNFSAINAFRSIRPGYKVGDPKVTDIKILKYTPDGTIYFKLKYDDDEPFSKLNQRQTVPRDYKSPEVLRPLYSKPLKINKTKYEHLQQLKQYLPKDVHSFYDNLSCE